MPDPQEKVTFRVDCDSIHLTGNNFKEVENGLGVLFGDLPRGRVNITALEVGLFNYFLRNCPEGTEWILRLKERVVVEPTQAEVKSSELEEKSDSRFVESSLKIVTDEASINRESTIMFASGGRRNFTLDTIFKDVADSGRQLITACALFEIYGNGSYRLGTALDLFAATASSVVKKSECKVKLLTLLLENKVELKISGIDDSRGCNAQ